MHSPRTTPWARLRSSDGACAVRSVVWSRPLDPEIDVVLLRSTWDYHLRLPEFLRWIDGLEARGIPLWNPPDTVRRNVDKRYLEVLASRGVPVVPLRQIPRGSSETPPGGARRWRAGPTRW